MRLADAGRTEEDDVLGALNKGEAGELVYLRARHAGGEAEVKAVECLDRRKPGDPGEHLAGSSAACITLGAQRLFKKVGERGLFRGGALGDAGIQVGHRAQPQLLAQIDNPLMLQIAHRAPPAKDMITSAEHSALRSLGVGSSGPRRLELL